MKDIFFYFFLLRGRVSRVNYLVFGNVFIALLVVIMSIVFLSVAYSIPFGDVGISFMKELQFIFFEIGESGSIGHVLKSSSVYNSSNMVRYTVMPIFVILIFIIFIASNMSFVVRRARDIYPSLSYIQVVLLIGSMFIPYFRHFVYFGLFFLSEEILITFFKFLQKKK